MVAATSAAYSASSTIAQTRFTAQPSSARPGFSRGDWHVRASVRRTVSVERSLAERVFSEAAWLLFYLPRGGVQALARKLPLDALRDLLPAAVSSRLRFGLYPARVTEPTTGVCAKVHAPWGDPPELDAAHPIRFDAPPRVSVLVVTHGNLALTRLCLCSIQRAASALPFEVVVVDNASTDGTPAYLHEVSAAKILPVTIVTNPDNRGFAAANNQAARLARGEILVLLNNDTVVPPGWLDGLVAHLDRNPSIGVVGPVTNSCGNEAAIATTYTDLGQMLAYAAGHMRAHAGELRDIEMLTLFCAALRRTVWDEVGGLDEQYRVGMFEDDDLAMAVRALGKRVALAADVFVHHYGGAAFGALSPRSYLRIWWENRRRFEAKWKVRWNAR